MEGAWVTHLPAEPAVQAALHVRRTGSILASWTRTGVPVDAAAVMTAAMYESIHTLGRILGSPDTGVVRVETDAVRLVVVEVDPRSILILVGADGESLDLLEAAAGRVVPLLRGGPGAAARRGGAK